MSVPITLSVRREPPQILSQLDKALVMSVCVKVVCADCVLGDICVFVFFLFKCFAYDWFWIWQVFLIARLSSLPPSQFNPILKSFCYLAFSRWLTFQHFSFFFSFCLNNVCPTLWSEVPQWAVLTRCQVLDSASHKKYIFLLLPPLAPSFFVFFSFCLSFFLSLSLCSCDVLTTNGYILRDNSIPWGYKPA